MNCMINRPFMCITFCNVQVNLMAELGGRTTSNDIFHDIEFMKSFRPVVEYIEYI